MIVWYKPTANEKTSAISSRRSFLLPLAIACCVWAGPAARTNHGQTTTREPSPPDFAEQIAPLLKSHCIKCHGPAKTEAGLNLSLPGGIARGGESGPAVVAHDLAASPLWQRVADQEMPPETPLSRDEQSVLKAWIEAGAPGLPTLDARNSDAHDHWAFRPLTKVSPPRVQHSERIRNAIDHWIEAQLEPVGLTISEPAQRARLLRRVSFLVTGLPPTPGEVTAFLADRRPDAYAHWCDNFLSRPQYGERWAKLWLDAAGYADSNGYFNADSDRPQAHRYRDYVIDAFNRNVPFDQFVTEQLAGDELVGPARDQTFTPEAQAQFIATHFLRNGQDGSGESDGNPDELRVDRYAALESCQQNVTSVLLGLTIQCAKCHDHKFEPITQADYYRLQSIFYPAFPAAHGEIWQKPQQRIVHAPLPHEQSTWESSVAQARDAFQIQQAELQRWASSGPPDRQIVWSTDFAQEALDAEWTNRVGDDTRHAGIVPVSINSVIKGQPAATIVDQRLQLMAQGTQGSSWLVSRRAFDWTPEQPGESITVSFRIVSARLHDDATPAGRFGYLIAVHDFPGDERPAASGNLLIDGNPEGPTTIYFDYPHPHSTRRETIGETPYAADRRVGVRITRRDDRSLVIEQLVDWIADERAVVVQEADLPNGHFAWEFCCDRSYIVDDLVIETSSATAKEPTSPRAVWEKELLTRREAAHAAKQHWHEIKRQRPGAIAAVRDLTSTELNAPLLIRGNYTEATEPMAAAPLTILQGAASASYQPIACEGSTGRRLAYARFLTARDSRAAALMARVQMNRLWQAYFGTGIVATTDNLGLSGAAPTQQELLDWLAYEFVASGWDLKQMHRLILASATLQQASEPRQADRARSIDPGNRRLWSFPMQRRDAESIRDSLLAVSGELDRTMSGPYVPTTRLDTGEVVVSEDHAGLRRRAIYLQQRRTMPMSLLQLFDAPTIVFNSTRRPRTTMPLQSLSLLNSPFVRARARHWAQRLLAMNLSERALIERAFVEAVATTPDAMIVDASAQFLRAQTAIYEQTNAASEDRASLRAWTDFCQSLMMSSEYLYVE